MLRGLFMDSPNFTSRVLSGSVCHLRRLLLMKMLFMLIGFCVRAHYYVIRCLIHVQHWGAVSQHDVVVCVGKSMLVATHV
jgi:hypothetical protein